MSKCENRKWEDILTIKNGKSQAKVINQNGQYPIYGSGGIMGYADDYICDENTVIIGRKGNINKPIFVETKFWNVDTAFGLQANKDLLIPKYLYYFCIKFNFEKLNTTVTIPSLTKRNLLNIIMPLPSLDIQKHIVETLDKVSKIINLHKKRLKELDNLIKSTFYDMFGDPVINEKKWQTEKLLGVCDKITDGTHDTPARYNEGILFITGKNIKPFEIDLKEIEFVSQEDHEVIYKRCNPEFKDVLYTNIGVNYGTAAINLLDYEFSMKNVALLKYKRNILFGEYLQCYLNYKREYIVKQNKTGGAQTFMGLATIKQLEINIPPLYLQNKFAKIVTKIEEQKILEKQSINESENLFNSLMSKYFD